VSWSRRSRAFIQPNVSGRPQSSIESEDSQHGGATESPPGKSAALPPERLVGPPRQRRSASNRRGRTRQPQDGRYLKTRFAPVSPCRPIPSNVAPDFQDACVLREPVSTTERAERLGVPRTRSPPRGRLLGDWRRSGLSRAYGAPALCTTCRADAGNALDLAEPSQK
jgi:hypothetical protein